MRVKAPIRNTQTQYAIRNAGQSPNTQYANAIRNSQCGSKPQYAIAYAIRNSQCGSKAPKRKTQSAKRETQHATRNTQYAIRNTQYAIRNKGLRPNTQYAIRNTRVGGSQWVRPNAIRNTQYAMLLKAGTQYAIRNTQYANPVKLYCVIRKRLPQYAIAQNAAYGVPLISLIAPDCT